MSDETTNENVDEKSENTPAGSYRVAGNDVSGYLGVDPEYMNYADETQKASLTEDEKFLFLPGTDWYEGGDEESSSEELDLADDDAESHDDDDEKKTYVEPAASSEGAEQRAPRPAL